MNQFRQTLRPFGAWLLVLLIFTQWVGGHVFINVVYTARIESIMNEKESAIAQKLKAEIGVTAHITIQKKEDLNVIQGMGYGAPFLFSEEENGETSYYTVDPKSPHGIRQEYKVDQQPNQEDRSAPKTFTERFFSDFCFEEHALLEVNPLHFDYTKTAQPLTFEDLIDLSNLSTPKPPPQGA
ncbi:hypothetical protein [Haliscomenobacter hydrossis]|uniref:hypothetical protein n=1 Tax=Haliscomenobacter hydrossis TaxID=2350 RepID=UPI0011D196EE|nr:hypothetical protein [Haliscomenobacter hydrossis]